MRFMRQVVPRQLSSMKGSLRSNGLRSLIASRQYSLFCDSLPGSHSTLPKTSRDTRVRPSYTPSNAARSISTHASTKVSSGVSQDEDLPKLTRLARLQHNRKVRPLSSFLTDTHSRHHNYLRISLTERCNLRCVYCMPKEGVTLSPVEENLTTPETVYLAELFVRQGVTKIRLTGGEPTVRRDILDLMHQLGQLRSLGLKELCITTNGVTLRRHLDSMLASGLTAVNLSLDSLDPFQYALMTRSTAQTWHAVMKSIDHILARKQHGGAQLKLKTNCVVVNGVNDHELIPFAEWTRTNDLEVRFIEYMPFSGNAWSNRKMLPYQEMLSRLENHFGPVINKVTDHPNETSKTYRIDGFRGKIGFVTSMTDNFCGTCNRLRITSNGNLKVCLFGNAEVSLRDVLRRFNDGRPLDQEAMDQLRRHAPPSLTSSIDGQKEILGDSSDSASSPVQTLAKVIDLAVKRKKARHAGLGHLEHMENRPMILIGG